MAAHLIVLSHLRWNFVFQRPQHVLSRLAKLRPVVFIEEPIQDLNAPAHWELSRPMPDVLVCKPHTPSGQGGYHDEQLPILKQMIEGLLKEQGVGDHVAWFYTPMALPLLDALDPQAVVYDCMDELSAFMHAPRELLEREARLLQQADVVFTGGPSLYESKKGRHANVHCFPSSVDAKHFGQAAPTHPLEEAADQRDLAHPRLGYFGVIDERMDLDLLDAMAKSHPDWQLVMVGPVVKIDPATLPRHPNIHYLGQKGYQELPGYLTGWDVCLLPFARNNSTQFISPTKTLEYMAAQRMIVSTPITDVAKPYGDIVYLGEGPEEFIQACEKALAAGDSERTLRLARMRKVLQKTSWDLTAQAMEERIAQVVEGQRRQRSSRSAAREKVKTPPVLVVGAGPTGLSAAYHLGEQALLLEKNQRVGGWCRSVQEKGFTFDHAGHIMFSKDPYVHELYEKLLGDNVHWQDREAWIYSKDVYTRYPFQGCLYGLPPEVITECIMGAIEARFGSLAPDKEMEDTVAAKAANRDAGNGNGHGAQKRAGKGRLAAAPERWRRREPEDESALSICSTGTGDVKDCCADGLMEAEVELGLGTPQAAKSASPQNFEEFIYKTWGKGIAKHFAIPYNKKLWAVPLSEMETSWLGGRVPMPNIEEMIMYALSPSCKPMGPNARFGYPLRGGFQALMDGFVPLLEGELRYNAGVTRVFPSRRSVLLSNGEELPYQYLISTMPLPALIRAMGQEVPLEVRVAASGLRHVSVRCVNIGVGREKLTDKHWIYYPEDTVFHRIFVQGNASPHCNPAGGFGLTCEITYSEYKPLPCDGEALIQRCIEDCHKVGMFTKEDPILVANQVDMPYAYVVYDHDRPRNVRIIRQWLEAQDIILAGRYSEWEYYNSDHAFVAGQKAAQEVQERMGTKVVRQESARGVATAS